ncbi:hypothetical protein BC830DRAFT_1108541 [Chytriomyces sp. MP71]|nr:hypothetical protein BC830DRAFT_1108541 [Chytriomyces sp. MP71]
MPSTQNTSTGATLSLASVSCPVCLSDFSRAEKVLPVTFACSHSMCHACLVAMIEMSPNAYCPVCRHRILSLLRRNHAHLVDEALLNHLEAVSEISSPASLVPAAALADMAPNKENHRTPRTASRSHASQPASTVAASQMRSLRSRSIPTSTAASAEPVRRLASASRVTKRGGGGGGGLVTAVFGKEEKSGRGGRRHASARAGATCTVRVVLPSSDDFGVDDESEDGEGPQEEEEEEEDQESHRDSMGGRYRLRNRVVAVSSDEVEPDDEKLEDEEDETESKHEGEGRAVVVEKRKTRSDTKSAQRITRSMDALSLRNGRR